MKYCLLRWSQEVNPGAKSSTVAECPFLSRSTISFQTVVLHTVICLHQLYAGLTLRYGPTQHILRGPAQCSFPYAIPIKARHSQPATAASMHLEKQQPQILLCLAQGHCGA